MKAHQEGGQYHHGTYLLVALNIASKSRQSLNTNIKLRIKELYIGTFSEALGTMESQGCS
eukprot:1158895-Pelagomonas_calceolata.AAC.12